MPPEVDWSDRLTEATQRLAKREQISPSIEQEVSDGIAAWKGDHEHGREHAMFVLEGAYWLAKRDGLPVNRDRLESAVMLHDLGQFLPLKNPSGNDTALYGTARTRHAQMMSVIIRKFSDELQLDPTITAEVARSIRVHDDVFAGLVHDDLSPTAKLLSDADKLFGASLTRQPAQLVKEVIQRNLSGLHKKSGWYLLRDLSTKSRDEWQYGDRWINDGLSAIRRQNKLHYYTQTARDVSHQMQQMFPRVAEAEYGNLYDQTQQNLSRWEQSLDQNKRIWMVGQGQQDQDVTGQSRLVELIDSAFYKTLKIDEKYLRGDMEARGWKLILESEGQELLIDPSVARFSNKTSFLSALNAALQ